MKKVLEVKYLAQYDSATSQGHRMCFSSTCAMALNFLKPGAIKGSGQLDDLYLARVNQFGDTTDPNAQVKALASYGLTGKYSQNLSLIDIELQIRAGKPVPCGILHKGHVTKPTGGGHWVLVVGVDEDRLFVNDPAGELDLINGGYGIGGSGDHVRYSKANFQKRWEVDGLGSGWGILF